MPHVHSNLPVQRLVCRALCSSLHTHFNCAHPFSLMPAHLQYQIVPSRVIPLPPCQAFVQFAPRSPCGPFDKVLKEAAESAVIASESIGCFEKLVDRMLMVEERRRPNHAESWSSCPSKCAADSDFSRSSTLQKTFQGCKEEERQSLGLPARPHPFSGLLPKD